MKRVLALLFLLALTAASVWFFVLRKPEAPEVAFARVQRETLVSELSTNGKTEPEDWTAVRSGRAGLVATVFVRRGQPIAAGAPLAALDTSEEKAEAARAEARLSQSAADLAALKAGGRPAELAEIDGSIAKLNAEREAAYRDLAAVQRLIEQKAAVAREAVELRDRLVRINGEMEALRRKRAALVTETDKAAAEARVQEARAALDNARRKIEAAMLRSPRAGTVYNLPVRQGAYLNPGDIVAEIGNLQRLRILVYVDEPDLGRLRQGLPVTVTWDALPDRTWTGTIETLPTQVVALGARQVGEVRTLVDNPGLDLPAGANINTRIRTATIENALTIPKEAIRRNENAYGVYLLDGVHLAWRKVTLGVSNVTRTQVTSGLTEGDSVALASDFPLKPGLTVTPAYR
jgi:HlyD family secretion protein